MRYRVVFEQTWSAEVIADSEDEAYDRFYNNNEYCSLVCDDETRVSIEEVGG